MNRLVICREMFQPKTWQYFDNIGNVTEFLQSQFTEMPTNARLYHGTVAEVNDVTPKYEEDIPKIDALEGEFWLMFYPEDPVTVGIFVAIGLAAVSIGLSFLMRPSIPQQTSQSPNNSLGNRENKARPNERIPDIYGTVRSVPDVLALTYKVFGSTFQEQEHSFYAVGRGYYAFDDMLDDQTPISAIDGSWCAVFAPGTSPNSGNAPQQTFGTVPTGTTPPKVFNMQQSSAVNGQTLSASNSGLIHAKDNIAFGYGGTVLTNDPSIDFTSYFKASNYQTNQIYYLQLVGSFASDPAQKVSSVNLDGTYVILSVSSNTLVLSQVASINANWNVLQNFESQQSTYAHEFTLQTTGDQWVGPYIMDVASLTEVWFNFVAEQNLYYVDDKGRQGALSATLKVGITALDGNNNPIGNEIFKTITLTGSSSLRSSIGATLKVVLPSVGQVQVRALNTTPIPTDTRNQYVTQIQWRDWYGISSIGNASFGDITTIQAITVPTQDATSIKKRKLNCQVTRLLPKWTGSTFTSQLYPTRKMADIVCAITLDQLIGRRQLSEIDTVGIYATQTQIETYFGTPLAGEFSYTFDDYKMSFEEMLTLIAQATNCTPYRRGNLIKMFFEQQTSNATLLFNHRNKVPDSEQRDTRFGTLNDNDGVEYTYVDPNAPNSPNVEANVTIYFPADRSAINAKKVTAKGVRNNVQAQLNGWRLYMKLLNQNTTVQMETTPEAELCIVNQAVMISDNTRPDTQDGDLLSQTGLMLTASQKMAMNAAYTYSMFMQLSDGTVQSIPVQAGTMDNQVILTAAPRLPLISLGGMVHATKLQMVSSANSTPTMFLVTEKTPQNGGTVRVTAVNYDDKYYSHDSDFIKGLITQNGSVTNRQPF